MSARGSDLRTQWQGWSQRFAALQPREKILIVAAVAVAVLFGGYSLWVEPGLMRAEQLKKSLDQQQAEQAQLQEQVAALVVRNSDPDSANRAELLRLRAEVAQTERDIGTFGNTLIPPQRIPALLQTLLTRHRGLTLVSLTTLPPLPLIAMPATGKEEAKPGMFPESFFKDLLFLIRGNSDPVVFADEGAPLLGFLEPEPDGRCLFPVPHSIVDEIEKNFLDQWICIDLNRSRDGILKPDRTEVRILP